MSRFHLEGRGACPFLPEVEEVLTAEVTRCLRRSHDAEFYLAALRYAQSLWLEGKAAQAILQLNKAFLADLNGTEPVLLDWPLPYAANRWLIANCPEGEFMGNPVRHYQHLATRMSGPRLELRRWRAWACFYLAAAVLPADRYSRDEEQIGREGIVIPEWDEVFERVRAVGLPGEADLVSAVIG